MGRQLGPRPGQVTLIVCALAAFSGAAEAQLEPEQLRAPAVVVRDLVGDDWKAAAAASREITRIGARGAPALLAARREASRAATRQALDEALREITRVLAEEIGRPLLAPAERIAADGALGGVLGACDRERPDESVPAVQPEALGDIGSISGDEPQDFFGRRLRARRARAALAWLGPPLTGFLLEVPPLREAIHQRALLRVIEHIYAAEREAALQEPAEAFSARYRGVGDLAAPILWLGVRDEEAGVRAAFQAVRDQVLAASLAHLASEDPQARRAAEDALYRLGHLAAQPLRRIAEGKNPAHTSAQAREGARRLARRIRYGISRDLVRRLGHDFAGYAERSFRERRALVFELERLGGDEAIPALRALLREEASDEVRMVAAIGLFRRGDPQGAEWFRRHRSGMPLVRISKRELAAIYMDQGLRYLTLGRFERAEREFRNVLEVEPKNDIAWYNLACTYSRWGKIDEALAHLEKSIEHGFDDASHMDQDPDLDPLRDDPRFQAMMRRLKGEEGAEPEPEDGPGIVPLDEPEPEPTPVEDDPEPER